MDPYNECSEEGKSGKWQSSQQQFQRQLVRKLERTRKCCFSFLKLQIHFLSLFSLFFFSFGNLQHHLSLDDVINVSKFPKEALEGSPLQSTQNNLTLCFSHRKRMGCFD